MRRRGREIWVEQARRAKSQTDEGWIDEISWGQKLKYVAFKIALVFVSVRCKFNMIM